MQNLFETNNVNLSIELALTAITCLGAQIISPLILHRKATMSYVALNIFREKVNIRLVDDMRSVTSSKVDNVRLSMAKPPST